MIAFAGYRAGFATLAIPGALALVVLLWLRLSVPHPLAYEAEIAKSNDVKAGGCEPLPTKFWLYLAFTCLAMLGFSTFAVPAYHMHVASVLADDMIPVS